MASCRKHARVTMSVTDAWQCAAMVIDITVRSVADRSAASREHENWEMLPDSDWRSLVWRITPYHIKDRLLCQGGNPVP
jgi:hypothetical protein